MAKKPKLKKPEKIIGQPKNKIREIQKPIILDNYKRALLSGLIFILVVSIFVPLIVFATIKNTESRMLNDKEATYLYGTLLNNYKLADKKSSVFSYTYEDGTNIKTEEFGFEKAVLTRRITIVQEETFATKTEIRRLKASDEAWLRANSGAINAMDDEQFADYLATTDQCLNTTYTKTLSDW